MTRKEEFESVDAEFTDLPDIPRYYYEKVVGNMAHEINMLKVQLESAVSRDVYDKRTQADETIIDSYRRELAELKSKFGSAAPNCKRCAIRELWEETEKEDLVAVVRCADCKFKSLYDDGDTKYYYCALEDRPNRNWSVDDTDYCSWGERSE